MKDFDNGNHESATKVVHIGQIELNADSTSLFSPEDLPILPTRNLVLFPGVTSPITIVRDTSLKVAETAFKNKISIGIVCQKDPAIENPTIDSLMPYGVVAEILQIINLPDNGKAVIVIAREKIKIEGMGSSNIISGALSARVKVVKDVLSKKDQTTFEYTVDNIRDTAKKLLKIAAPEGSQEFIMGLDTISDPIQVVNMIASNFPIEPTRKIELLRQYRLIDRAMDLLTELNSELWKAQEKERIQQEARKNMEAQSRNAFLQSQMETIRQELYGDDDDAEKLLDRAASVPFPDAVRTTFEREIEKLRRLNPSSPDYSVLYSYLETLLDLPWLHYGELNTDFKTAAEILEDDHYGLEKVKERILEELAMMINNPEGKSPIICLVGPPGVGKTSIGRSIAKALGREYQRISLGGLHDEAEIRGHRRTYIGAMPGRIIDALKKCATSNPVLLLDEIDKIGADYKGDPAAALLEVLDPEQNCRFHDNYIDVDYDLSSVLFIATANTLSTIAQPLIDRMEIIEIPGYLLEEKIEIGKRHLLPRLIKESGAEDLNIELTNDAFQKIIENYTAESGVRLLEKNIASIIRKLILRKMKDLPFENIVDSKGVRDLLGVEKYTRDKYEDNRFAGVVAGLAWTAVGGEILFIESSLTPAKEGRLTLTGNLGDVMKESAMIAHQYIKAHAQEFGIEPEMFDKYSIHIHVPEGAIPKDGPSAGITMATSIVSAYTKRKVLPALAMTGEITLRGKVLPVGGIREKILAAKRAGITTVILSKENRKDFEEINPALIENVNFIFVDNVTEVIDNALTKEIAVD